MLVDPEKGLQSQWSQKVTKLAQGSVLKICRTHQNCVWPQTIPKPHNRRQSFYTAASLAGTVRLGAAESDEKWLY